MSKTFIKELEELLNKHNVDTDTNTPDFLLARYLVDVITGYAGVVSANEKWHESPNIKETGEPR